MANEVTVTVADVRPLNTAVPIRAKATEALAFGDAVYIDSATGDIPNVSKADASAVDALLVAVGIVVATTPDNPGATSVALGDPCDVAIFGEVTGYSSMTPGQTIWLSDTVGRLSTVAGTKSTVIGVAKSAATVIVNPGYYLRAS
jgi:hypothetical protein